MENKDRKFFFDVNIFDAPPKEDIDENLPPPPPVYSEEELAAARDMSFEMGRQQGQKEQTASREQFVAVTLDKILQNFSLLFAAELSRESVFEREALRLSIQSLDLLFPSLTEKIGAGEVYKVIEKTMLDHRKTKEIVIRVAPGMKGEIETMLSRLRAGEHEAVQWRVNEDSRLTQGDCALEWGDGGAVRDSVRTARDIRRNIEKMLGEPMLALADIGDSELTVSDVLSMDNTESPAMVEKTDE